MDNLQAQLDLVMRRLSHIETMISENANKNLTTQTAVQLLNQTVALTVSEVKKALDRRVQEIEDRDRDILDILLGDRYKMLVARVVTDFPSRFRAMTIGFRAERVTTTLAIHVS